jgi:hypothetical protein
MAEWTERAALLFTNEGLEKLQNANACSRIKVRSLLQNFGKGRSR